MRLGQRSVKSVRRLRSRMSQNSILEVFPEIAAYRLRPVSIGESASSVYHLTCPGRPALYMKTAAAPDVLELEAEYARLAWLKDKVPVAEIVDFRSNSQQAALLTRALPGANAIYAAKRNRWAVVSRLAGALRELHAIPTAGCPFDRSLAVVIDSARERVMAGRVDESDFDEEHKGLRARDLLTLLKQQQPATENLVITHGDACLPNIVFEGSYFRGFVDCGRSGLADAYQDLALASRSIARNYGRKYVNAFFESYGLREVDDSKLSYYRLADEFF